MAVTQVPGVCYHMTATLDEVTFRHRITGIVLNGTGGACVVNFEVKPAGAAANIAPAFTLKAILDASTSFAASCPLGSVDALKITSSTNLLNLTVFYESIT